MSAAKIKDDLQSYARSLGFERMGVTSAEPLLKDEEFLKRWIAEGHPGEMDYLKSRPETRSRPRTLLPDAKSVISLAIHYNNTLGTAPTEQYNASVGTAPTKQYNVSMGAVPSRTSGVVEARIARYADGRDYHKVLKKRLDGFIRYLEALAPGVACRTFVDTGPLLERAFARRAGIGFIGKNTLLITKGLGSWVFLASVITTLELPCDAPDNRSCGECRLCLDACPTEALTAPFQLDARRCISYLTIEKDGPLQEDLKEKMGSWIFGCDICQEVCPHNARKEETPGPSLGLAEILAIQTEDEFRKRFAGTPLTRAGRDSLVRNACVAAANLERRDLIPQLEKLSRLDPHDVVREQAAWALERLC